MCRRVSLKAKDQTKTITCSKDESAGERNESHSAIGQQVCSVSEWVKVKKKKKSVLASIHIFKLVKWETNVGWITVCLNSTHLQGGASVEMSVGETSKALAALTGGRKGSDVGKEFGSR